MRVMKIASVGLSLKNGLRLLAILSGLMVAQQAMAACSVVSGGPLSSYSFTVPNIRVATNVPPGTIIWEGQVPVTSPVSFSCDPINNYSTVIAPVQGTDTGIKIHGNYAVYSIPGVTGVGYALSYDAGGGVFSYNGTDSTFYKGFPVNGTQSANGGVHTTKGSFALVVTGKVSPGILPSGNYGRWTVGGNLIIANWITNSSTITPVGCEVAMPNINIPLNDHVQSEFIKVGYYSSYVDFNVGLNCDASTKYSAKISGNAVPGVNGVIALDNPAASTTAQGIGVWLTDRNDVTWIINQMYDLGTASDDGRVNIPMRARYYQYQGAVTPGDANATATMTVLYQ
ncbi:fimbrial protein [Dryocola clanedunensis]